MRTKIRKTMAGWLLTTSFAAPLHGQAPTIPEKLRQAGMSLTGHTGVPSGPSPVFADILRDSDIVVRGFVGAPRSYLSEDQREVLTDFPITHPEFLYQRPSDRISAHATLTVTLVGGKVTIGAF